MKKEERKERKKRGGDRERERERERGLGGSFQFNFEYGIINHNLIISPTTHTHMNSIINSQLPWTPHHVNVHNYNIL